jgi:uncharacterized membrane protein
MKNKIYKISSVLIIVLSAINARSEVIIGISDPFQFGPDTSSVAIPLSPLALIIPILMIALYTYWRYIHNKRKEAV